MSAPWWTAFLRGINVGGHHKVSKDILVAVAGACGGTNVTSLLASGNLLYRSAATDGGAAAWPQALEAAVGWTVPVLCLPLADLAAMCAAARALHPRHEASVYVSLLAGEPRADGASSLSEFESTDHRVSLIPGAAVVLARGGYRFTPFANDVIEKHLETTATTRKLTTLLKLLAKAE